MSQVRAGVALVVLGSVPLSGRLRPQAEPEPRVLGAWAIARRERRDVDVVVCDTGILLVEPMVSGRGFQLSRATRPRQESERLLDLVRAGVPTARQHARCTWIGTDDVVAARGRPGPSRLRIDLVLADGRRTRITSREHTAVLGDPATALTHLLGARLSREAWQSAAG